MRDAATAMRRHPFLPFAAAGVLQRLFRALFNLDFPDPEVGQVWLSMHSGRRIRVARVDAFDQGGASVAVASETVDGGRVIWSPVWSTYAHSLADWRRNLRAERRVLVE